jgi:hypothetical protein
MEASNRYVHPCLFFRRHFALPVALILPS